MYAWRKRNINKMLYKIRWKNHEDKWTYIVSKTIKNQTCEKWSNIIVIINK